MDAHVSGRAFLGDDHYDPHDLARLISNLKTLDDLRSIAHELNGFYAIVKRFPDRLVAYVDRTRGIPLFWGEAGGRFYLSDNAEWVREQVGDAEPSGTAINEFALTGYVTGAGTLYPNVRQLQAGESLIVRDLNDGIRVQTDRYYRFWHSEPTGDDQDLEAHLAGVMLNSMRRLVKFADGRQLVVPLSGGFDSRLIALLLRGLGYSNVVTFTYGVPGNRESVISRRVAEQLGFAWKFVEYNKALWGNWARSDEYEQFRVFGSGWSSLPHLQDWPAVWELKLNGMLSSDAIFVPGHTGDFICGGHIPELFRQNSKLEIEDFVEGVFERHYTLWQPGGHRGRELREQFRNRILEVADVTHLSDPVHAANAYEMWEWQERQAKYIVNSVRVYEFWGYDWWCPFWDHEVMRFWANVPFRHRTPELYQQYVNGLWASICGMDQTPAAGPVQNPWVKALASSSLGKLLRKSIWINRGRGVVGALRHPMAGFGDHGKVRTIARFRKGYNLLGMIAQDFLQNL